MTETEFNALAAQGYNRIPVSLETFADLDTPLSIYMKLANGPYTYLLESVQGGERFGRYSIIGLAASTRIVVNGESRDVGRLIPGILERVTPTPELKARVKRVSANCDAEIIR